MVLTASLEAQTSQWTLDDVIIVIFVEKVQLQDVKGFFDIIRNKGEVLLRTFCPFLP